MRDNLKENKANQMQIGADYNAVQGGGTCHTNIPFQAQRHKFEAPGGLTCGPFPPCVAPFCFGCLNAHFHSFLFKADAKIELLLCVGSFHHAALNLHQFDGQWRG
ncbi:hypothetical protein ES332_A13G153400v1 [Gossypium tomentosum]|uniref:Uncharacterized protein n=1 Tax=Gossypium tomentosum TaxID=34277 RepID=A0A5D2MLE8_GOSTO|nr:hypothetical protein ES332_A13G153400v1 [Gossypium tomentosum]